MPVKFRGAELINTSTACQLTAAGTEEAADVLLFPLPLTGKACSVVPMRRVIRLLPAAPAPASSTSKGNFSCLSPKRFWAQMVAVSQELLIL